MASEGRLQALRCEACETTAGEVWCRVLTYRGPRQGQRQVLVSELSWALARRVVPALLRRYGWSNIPSGLFAGGVVLPGRGEEPSPGFWATQSNAASGQ